MEKEKFEKMHVGELTDQELAELEIDEAAEQRSKNQSGKKEKFNPSDDDIEFYEDPSKVRVFVSPLEGRLSMGREEDVLYQLVLLPACEEVTIKGKTLGVSFVKGLEGLKYCSLKKIGIRTLALHEGFILVNGNIHVKTEGNSESVELEKAIFWSEDSAMHEADRITKETLKRLEYLMECLEGARNLLKKQTKKGIY